MLYTLHLHLRVSDLVGASVSDSVRDLLIRLEQSQQQQLPGLVFSFQACQAQTQAFLSAALAVSK